ncbi:MAG: HAMP domain-containing protein [gamma proteobacterium symbiont of Taylorina sp.]|nr:HAMP domain-containing protein [gamma proteobacterium symbiont of Taylorina sp.]
MSIHNNTLSSDLLANTFLLNNIVEKILGTTIAGTFFRIAVINTLFFAFILWGTSVSNTSNSNTVNFALMQVKQINDKTIAMVQKQGIQNIEDNITSFEAIFLDQLTKSELFLRYISDSIVIISNEQEKTELWNQIIQFLIRINSQINKEISAIQLSIDSDFDNEITDTLDSGIEIFAYFQDSIDDLPEAEKELVHSINKLIKQIPSDIRQLIKLRKQNANEDIQNALVQMLNNNQAWLDESLELAQVAKDLTIENNFSLSEAIIKKNSSQIIQQSEMGEISIQSARNNKLKSVTNINQTVSQRQVIVNQKQSGILQKMEEKIHQQFIYLLIIISIMIMIIGSLSYFIINSILKKINHLVAVMENVQANSEFEKRVQISGKDEISRIGLAFNNLLDALQSAIVEVNSVMSAVAEGNFEKRIKTPLHGDLDTLKNAVNGSADSVDTTMNALADVMQALSDGDFKVRMNSQVKGEFRHKVDNAMNSIDTALTEIGQIMLALTQGDFSQRIHSQFNGELNILKDNINLSINGLDNAINEIAKVTRVQQKGNLTVQVEGSYLGQLGVLKKAINTSAQHLMKIVSEIREAANSVSISSQELSQGNIDLSHRTEEQASSLEETAASLEQINSTVKQSAENSELSNIQVEKSYQQAQQGGKIVDQAIKAMQQINDSSQQIANIINIIDEIAFQTNLLALNAAVEAARAGEQGRAFAVVAEAVRSLAQRSSNSAKDIKRLINKSVDLVEEGSHLVNHSGDTLEQIIKSVMNVKTMINEIVTSNREQSAGIDQINTAMTHMDETTQQNAALVEQAAATSETVSENAEQLLKMVDFFQISRRG